MAPKKSSAQKAAEAAARKAAADAAAVNSLSLEEVQALLASNASPSNIACPHFNAWFDSVLRERLATLVLRLLD